MLFRARLLTRPLRSGFGRVLELRAKQAVQFHELIVPSEVRYGYDGSVIAIGTDAAPHRLTGADHPASDQPDAVVERARALVADPVGD